MLSPTFTEGTHTLSAHEGKIVVRVWKQGLLSRLGHDLVLSCDDVSLQVTIPPAQEAAKPIQVLVRIAKAGFRVIEPASLSGKDKAEIRDKIQNHLPTDITASLTWPSKTASLHGSVTLGSKTASLTIPLVWDAPRVKGEVRLLHRELGVNPYRAPLGLIQLKEEIDISLDIDLGTLLKKEGGA